MKLFRGGMQQLGKGIFKKKQFRVHSQPIDIIVPKYNSFFYKKAYKYTIDYPLKRNAKKCKKKYKTFFKIFLI